MTWLTSRRRQGLPSDWSTVVVPGILDRDDHLCKLRFAGCMRVATEVDHKVRGDDHRPSNLQAVCKFCHAKKSSREGNEVQARRRALRKRPLERHPGDKTL